MGFSFIYSKSMKLLFQMPKSFIYSKSMKLLFQMPKISEMPKLSIKMPKVH